MTKWKLLAVITLTPIVAVGCASSSNDEEERARKAVDDHINRMFEDEAKKIGCNSHLSNADICD